MEHEKDERTLGLSTAQVVGSVLAAVTGAVLASTMGVTGTVIGAAVASLVATIGSAIYTWSLRRTTVAVRKTAAQVRQAALESGPLPRTVAQGPLRTIKERAAASTAEQGPDGQEQDQDPDQDPDGQQPIQRRDAPARVGDDHAVRLDHEGAPPSGQVPGGDQRDQITGQVNVDHVEVVGVRVQPAHQPAR